MSQKKYRIDIPASFIDENKLESDKVLQVRKEDNRLILEKPMIVKNNEAISLKYFIYPSIVMTLIFCYSIYQKSLEQIPLTGNFSIASHLIYLGLISGMCSFSYFFIKGKRNPKNKSTLDIYWRNVPTIIFSFTVTLALLLSSFFWMISKLFVGASFDEFTAIAIFFMFACIINYFMIYSANIFTSSMIVSLLIAVIIGGVFFAMLTNSQSKWWQHNFSYLGTNEAIRSWPFNLTLILASLLMIALVDYLFVNLKNHGYHGRGITSLRILMILLSLSLGGVGFFPNNEGVWHELHNHAANLLVFIIILLIIGIKWLLPKVTKEFLIVSYGIAIILLVANFLFETIGYLSLTVFEIIAFGLAFSWILLLLQHINRLCAYENDVILVKLEEITK